MRTSSRKSPNSIGTWRKKAERALQEIVARARLLPALRRICPSPIWQIEIDVVGREAMRRLNQDTRGKDQPTDVLSFELPEAFRKQGMIGQLVICLPMLRAQARQLGHSDQAELQVLVVHGLLHLLGFDHEKGAQAAREMGRYEARLLGEKADARGLIRRNQPCIDRRL